VDDGVFTPGDRQSEITFVQSEHVRI